MTIDRWWQITWETGPDAGESWTTNRGRHVVGRAPQAEIRCDDPALEPFHVQLDLSGAAPAVRQLAGRLPVRVDAADATGPWRVQLGNSVLHIECSEPERAAAVMPTGDRRVVRVPRHLPTWSPEAVRLEPEPHPPLAPSGGLIPIAAAALGTAVMALLVRQMLFVVMGAMGTLVAAAAWISARVGHRRSCRTIRAAAASDRARAAAATDDQRLAWARHMNATVPTLHESVALTARPNGLWQRRLGDADAWTASLGIGALAWAPIVEGGEHDVRAQEVDHLSVAFDLAPGARLAISGPHAFAVANALVLQMAALTGPADWQLVVVTASPEQWRWTRHLPHAHDALGRHLVVDETALVELLRDGSLLGRHTVVITDQAAMLTVRTSALRRVESAHDSLALVVVHHGATPAACRSSVVTMSDGRARFVADLVVEPAPVVLRLAGSPAQSAGRWARQLTDRRDPEDERLNGLDMPATVGLHGLLADLGIDVADAVSIAGAWSRAGHDPAPRAPIGRARDGVVEIDLVRDGPHALLAGTTGAGKSELLRSLVLGLSCVLSPDHLTFVLVDYKGGAAFDELTSLPHVVGTVTDLDHQLAERALRSLRAELTVRERMLRQHGVGDLTALRAKAGAPVVPSVLVVVDEFAALATEQPDFLHALVGIAQRGRSLGVHLLLATQRPSGVISDDIRANTNLRIALRLHDTADALDVVGDAAPASLPRSLPGRAVMRLGPDELVTFQTAHATQVADVVANVCRAAEQLRIAPPRRVWCEPLAPRIEHDAFALTPGAIGMQDLPDDQTQGAFCWRPIDGSVLVVGAPGSGVTSTLVTLATVDNDAGDLFVIDAGNDAQWDAVAGHYRCAGVVRLHERERLWRLLARVARHGTSATRLVIDGLGALRHELDAVERTVELELLERIITAADTVLLIGAERVAAVPPSVVSRCAVRLVLHLHDQNDAAAIGVPSASVPPAIAGRAVLGASGIAVQLVAPRPMVLSAQHGGRVPVVGTLPEAVRADALPPATHHDIGWRAPIGIGFRELEPIALDVPDGEHVLIAGTARTGRSTALAQLCIGWSASHDLAHVVVLGGRRSPLAGWLSDGPIGMHDGLEAALDDVQSEMAAGRRVMLAVDDAEMVDDPSGRLAALAGQRSSGLLVVAAGRPDALRQSYGHWTVAIRRSRLGLLSAGAQDVDADLLGATLPRRALLAPRPGLFHLVDGGSVEMVQLAQPSFAHATRRRCVAAPVS